MLHRESLLDEYCDDVTDMGSIRTSGTDTSTLKNLNLSSCTSNTSTLVTPSVKNKKTKDIDPTKKSKLLQALKAIDGSEEQIN